MYHLNKLEKLINDKNALRDEKKALRDEKKDLRDKEKDLRTKEQILLQQQTNLSHSRPSLHPNSRSNSNDRHSSMTDIQKMKEALKQIEASHTAPPQASPSILGGDAIDHLKRNSRFVEFKCDDMEKRSVLTLDQQKSLEGCQTEQQVVAFITQYLEKLVQELEHYVLVNSEYNPWLEVGDDALSKNSKKPDLFILVMKLL